MNKKYFFMVLALIIISLPGFAATRAITANGEKVLLEADGTWRAVVSNQRNSLWLREPEKIRLENPDNEKELSRISQENHTGSVYYKTTEGEWQAMSPEARLVAPMSFKTDSQSSLKLKIAEDNVLKLYPETMITIQAPEIANRQVKKQVFEISYGEVNAAISLDGRDKLQGKAGKVNITFNSGLSKLIIDKNLKGEAVVKNGIIILQLENNKRKKTKVSGFYKATLNNNKISPPAQASVIQYDWR